MVFYINNASAPKQRPSPGFYPVQVLHKYNPLLHVSLAENMATTNWRGLSMCRYVDIDDEMIPPLSLICICNDVVMAGICEGDLVLYWAAPQYRVTGCRLGHNGLRKSVLIITANKSSWGLYRSDFV